MYGRNGDIDGVWIAPVIAQLIMTLPDVIRLPPEKLCASAERRDAAQHADAMREWRVGSLRLPVNLHRHRRLS